MGLRERKKEQTRRAIEDAAFRLFEERGYAATTVADIADAADIAPRTFFAYFPSKEAVVFGEFPELFAALQERMAARGPGEDTFVALRAWIHELLERAELEGEPERELLRKCLIEDNEALAAQQRHQMGRFEELIAEHVAIDLGDQPGDLRPKLVAAAAVAAFMSMSPEDPDERAQRQKKGLDAEGLAQLDDAFAFLRGGIAALQERRSGVRETAPRHD